MSVLLSNFKNVFIVSDLRRKMLFTFFVLGVYRLGGKITIPGINTEVLWQRMQQAAQGALGGILSYLDLISGGAVKQFSIFALGIGPYISASIMMTLLTILIPTLEQLSKEGERGRQVINQYTRYLTAFLALIQGTTYIVMAESYNVVLSPGWGFRLTGLLILMVGALFVMWLGEQISAHGIGNGSSMIIFGGIVAGLPSALYRLYQEAFVAKQLSMFSLVLIGAITVGVTMCVVFLERGERKIPVQYAKRVVGNKMYGGQSSYIPLKINSAGVIPVIFAQQIIAMPMMFANMIARSFPSFKIVSEIFAPQGFVYNILMALLVVFFSYFYTAIIFNPEELAENMRKSGGFIPGIRPGRQTAAFFNYVLTRVSFPGAVYLATLVIAPGLVAMFFKTSVMFTGTGLLIVVGVALDTSAQIESKLIERRYEGFLSTGRLRGRVGR